MSNVDQTWEQAVETGVVPVSGPFTHDDLFRALAFGVEASSEEGPAESHYHLFSQADLMNYMSIRRAQCVGGHEVRDRMLKRMEAAMSPTQRQLVETRLAEEEATAIR